jgi:hypothetical protein
MTTTGCFVVTELCNGYCPLYLLIFLMEAPEETVINHLQALASYGTIAAKETLKALTTPENVPIFLSSLVKFSLGPTLAFLWGRRAFKQEEAFKNAKEAEAVRIMLRTEIDSNLERIECLIRQFSYLVEVIPQDKVKGALSSIRGRMDVRVEGRREKGNQSVD